MVQEANRNYSNGLFQPALQFLLAIIRLCKRLLTYDLWLFEGLAPDATTFEPTSLPYLRAVALIYRGDQEVYWPSLGSYSRRSLVVQHTEMRKLLFEQQGKGLFGFFDLCENMTARLSERLHKIPKAANDTLPFIIDVTGSLIYFWRQSTEQRYWEPDEQETDEILTQAGQSRGIAQVAQDILHKMVTDIKHSITAVEFIYGVTSLGDLLDFLMPFGSEFYDLKLLRKVPELVDKGPFTTYEKGTLASVSCKLPLYWGMVKTSRMEVRLAGVMQCRELLVNVWTERQRHNEFDSVCLR